MMHPRTGFTLIEMLVVMTIIACCASMIFATGTMRRDERRAQVQGAATELAGVLRKARAFAMERNIVAALSFNIENAPGSSGWTLNNRSGGHWYRIVGAATWSQAYGFVYNQSGHFPFPHVRYNSSGSDYPFSGWLNAIDGAWYGDRHVLPKGKVRFLAIGDQDNGGRSGAGNLYQPAGQQHFYPRPWFGRWDEAGRRLHPWGGYNPACKDFVSTVRTCSDGSVMSYSGFYYEGYDGRITGCVNPAERRLVDDTNGDFLWDTATDGSTQTFLLYEKDKPRPLIDARWLDLYFIFYPDGTATWGPPLSARREWGSVVDAGLCKFGRSLNVNLGPGERLNHLSSIGTQSMFEVGSYLQHTGAWYITLGPDLPDTPDADQGRYASAMDAIKSMMPMFRVYVTPGGEIGTFEVSPWLPKPPRPAVTWDSTVNAAAWQSSTFLSTNYPDGSLREADHTPRSRPVVDFLVPEMLVNANWWMQ